MGARQRHRPREFFEPRRPWKVPKRGNAPDDTARRKIKRFPSGEQVSESTRCCPREESYCKADVLIIKRNYPTKTGLHHARRETMVVVVTVWNRVSDLRTCGGGCTSRDQAQRRRAVPPLYKMLEQFAGAGTSIRRFALFGS
jgi:hypothetical protein